MYSNPLKVKLLSALASEVRLEILTIIARRESSVGNLSARLKLSQSAVSQHLAKLRNDGLVSTRRDAQTVYYTCTNRNVQRVLDLLNEIFSSHYNGGDGNL